MKKAIVLDRDGTIIVDRIYLNDPTQIEYLPGVFGAMRTLRDLGYVFAIATNQSGVPRGLVDVRNLEEIHRIIQADFCREGVDILSFHSAPYMTDSNHRYRKPNPGMLFEAVRWHRLDASRSWMIGDRYTDVQAGWAAGMKGVLLSPDTKWTLPDLKPDLVVPSLVEFAEYLSRTETSKEFSI